MSAKRRVAVMISGRGSNLRALAAAATAPDFPAAIALVVSDRADAAGLDWAEKAGLAHRAVPREDFASKAAHERAIEDLIEGAGAEFICLAGYMRLLSPGFAERWQGRMINVHPALLPAFKGLDTHARALAAGVRLHGCTVHFVTPDVDDGPIVAQAAVPVLTGDTAEALAARVLKAEHALLPRALRLLCEGRVRMEGGRSVFDLGGMAERGETQSLSAPLLDDLGRGFEDLARLTP